MKAIKIGNNEWLIVKNVWSAVEVREFCIKHNYYTLGTNDEYSKMLNYVNENEPTQSNIILVAKDIYEHSEVEDNALNNIIFEIDNDIVFTCYETVDTEPIMTENKIYSYAWSNALDIWHSEKERLEKDPDNEIMKSRVNKVWSEIENLHREILEIERMEKSDFTINQVREVGIQSKEKEEDTFYEEEDYEFEL